MYQCSLCGSKRNYLIHKGVRDNKNIDVLKCEECGLVFLSDMSGMIDAGFYEEGGMHSGVNSAEANFDVWRNNSYQEDMRRAKEIISSFGGGKLLDFGCGNGGFLKILKEKGLENVYGVELEDNCRERLKKEGICVRRIIDEYEEEFDYVTMFHVIEHLANPNEYLEKIWHHMKTNGELQIETPNADDVLLSLYECEAFADFTYWSCHVMLYNVDTLSKLLQNNGFEVTGKKQIQRFPVSNHLYWLSKGMPGGHNKWSFLNDDVMNDIYTAKLVEMGKCDTILLECKKIE